MKLKFIFIFVLMGLIGMPRAVLADADADAAAEWEALRQTVVVLEAEVARLRQERGVSERLAELERRIDLVAAELEKIRTGATHEPAVAEGQRGFAPAASKVYSAASGVSIGGYGELVFEGFSDRDESGGDAGRRDQLDFLRHVLYAGYKFDDKWLLNSEIEFEHASTGERGEVSVEFAYIDYRPLEGLGMRAGLLLVPMGFVNELHEAPVFHGSKRPDVERNIIPTTWRENGVGLFGEAGPVEWRAYVTAGLSSAGFSASGLRGGRQKGSRSLAEDFAFTARVDVTPVPGLLVGGAVYTGRSGQGAQVEGQRLSARVSVFDLHAQYRYRGLQLRVLAARSLVDDAARINVQNGLTGSASVGEAQYGYYAEAAFDVVTLAGASRLSVTPFVRYERLDTQDGVPDGFFESPATERSVLTLGVGVKPLPNVVFKADFARHRNRARQGISQFNLAMGYLF